MCQCFLNLNDYEAKNQRNQHLNSYREKKQQKSFNRLKNTFIVMISWCPLEIIVLDL